MRFSENKNSDEALALLQFVNSSLFKSKLNSVSFLIKHCSTCCSSKSCSSAGCSSRGFGSRSRGSRRTFR